MYTRAVKLNVATFKPQNYFSFSLRGCSHEFHSGMSFVPEWSSYCIHTTKSTDSAIRLTYPENDTHAPLAPRLHGLRFHLGTEFVFNLHDTRMKCHTTTRISFGLKTGMNSFQNDLCGNEIWSRYHINRYRKIYGDGMNSFWNESHSGSCGL